MRAFKFGTDIFKKSILQNTPRFTKQEGSCVLSKFFHNVFRQHTRGIRVAIESVFEAVAFKLDADNASLFLSLLEKSSSFIQYRTFIRISKAKELLSLGKKNLNEIAEECGFSSANYFSLIFKKEVGISPNNYRKAK